MVKGGIVMRQITALITLLFLLVGCSAATVPVYMDAVDETGKSVPVIAGYTKEASVFKEQQVHETLRNRDTQHAKMYAKSGFKMTFVMQEVSPGVFVLLPNEISFREEPDFDQMLPIVPSVHPVWKTTENVFGTLAKYGLIGFGLSELSGVLQAGYDNAGPTFNGDSNIENAWNSAGGDQGFTGSSQFQGDFGGADEAGCFISPGCSCESFLAGTCK